MFFDKNGFLSYSVVIILEFVKLISKDRPFKNLTNSLLGKIRIHLKITESKIQDILPLFQVYNLTRVRDLYK